MKLVIDSNGLRDKRLLAFLQQSPNNKAVITDYAAMEALKGDPMVGMSESMKIVSRFPDQVWLLKNTLLVCGLSGVSKGRQRRLLDVPITKNFAQFCAALQSAKQGNARLQGQLDKLGREARTHLLRIEKDAPGFARNGAGVVQEFSPHERAKVVSNVVLDAPLLNKLMTHVAYLAAVLFESHPQVKKLPNSSTVLGTYIFRSSLAHMLLAFQYASYGGVATKSTAKIRNDMVDSHFAAYATFFDGLLSNDRRTIWLADRSTSLLRQVLSQSA